MDICICPSKLNGNVIAQPSKSDSHRNIICAAFAEGISEIDNIIMSEDIKATLRGVEAAGCVVSVKQGNRYKERHRIIIGGVNGGFSEEKTIECGESGSTLRFLSMIFAAKGGKTTITGKGRLPKRPMEGAFKIFEEHGITYSYPGNGKYLPLIINGTMESGDYFVEASVTSQYLSGLLMALPAAHKYGNIYVEGAFESRGYVDMTINTIKMFGVDIKEKKYFEIPQNTGLKATDRIIEGDWSNASYFLVMKTLGADVTIEGLQNETKQPDSVVQRLMDEIQKKETCDIDVSECPDLMPALSVLAAATDGDTVITGAKRLRIKESDRIKAVAAGLKNLGVKTIEYEDGIKIFGGGKITGGIVDSYDDHRIAMAFASLCGVSSGDIYIKGAECVDKSYPAFFEDLVKIGGNVK